MNVVETISANKKTPFDLEVEIEDENERLSKEQIIGKLKGERVKYVRVRYNKGHYFISIRLTEMCYLPIKENVNLQRYLIPYFFVFSALDYQLKDYRFNEILFEYHPVEDEMQKYREVIEHIRSLNLPLSLVDDDVFSSLSRGTMAYHEIHDCVIHLEDSKKWPRNVNAIKCAKTAFYCQIFSKSSMRYLVDHEYVMLKHNRSKFKFRITLKGERTEKDEVFERLIDVINNQSPFFKEGVVIIKQFLGNHGYYPLLISDELIEIIGLIIGTGIINPGMFFDEYLKYDFQLKGKCFDLMTMKLNDSRDESRFILIHGTSRHCLKLPDDMVFTRLRGLNGKLRNMPKTIFDVNFNLLTNIFLVPTIKDYDVIFSRTNRRGFKKVHQKTVGVCILGKPVPSSHSDFFGDMERFAYLFYSPLRGLLMVKGKEDVDVKLLCMVLLLKTSFEYVMFN
jgi:hypothetical protein